jgi:hypothetical protein
MYTTKYYSGDQIKKNEMGEACFTNGERYIEAFDVEVWQKKTTWKT